MTPLLFLFLTFQQHETIVVTGAYEPLSLDEMDRAVRVLPVRENRLLFESLAAVLSLIPSVTSAAERPTASRRISRSVAARSGETLVLLNGQRLNDAQSAHHYMDIPAPLDSIQRVEVLRGSGSTM